jgi:hypothetical protein
MKIKSEMAQVYGVPLPTLLVYLKNQNSVEQQALQQSDISNCMRIHGTKHDDMKNELFDWFAILRRTLLHWMAKQ